MQLKVLKVFLIFFSEDSLIGKKKRKKFMNSLGSVNKYWRAITLVVAGNFIQSEYLLFQRIYST